MWAVMPKKIWLLTVLVGIPFLLLVLTGGLRVVLPHPGDQVPRLLFVFVLAAAPPVLAEYSIMKSWKRDPRVHASIRGDPRQTESTTIWDRQWCIPLVLPQESSQQRRLAADRHKVRQALVVLPALLR